MDDRLRQTLDIIVGRVRMFASLEFSRSNTERDHAIDKELQELDKRQRNLAARLRLLELQANPRGLGQENDR